MKPRDDDIVSLPLDKPFGPLGRPKGRRSDPSTSVVERARASGCARAPVLRENPISQVLANLGYAAKRREPLIADFRIALALSAGGGSVGRVVPALVETEGAVEPTSVGGKRTLNPPSPVPWPSHWGTIQQEPGDSLARTDMKHLIPFLTLFFCGVTGAWAQSDPGTDVAIPNEPILSGHSHNDYLRQTPLWDALSLGFISIEVDIFLVEGALLVGHEEEDLDATRTLQALYLDPLRDHVRAHDGWVYPSEHSLDLLIDIKSDARSTYEALRGVLAQYSEMLTTYSETQVQTRAISVIVSGNRPRRLMMAEAMRIASYDGRIEDIEDSAARVPTNFISMISDNWENHFSWRGSGSLSEGDSRRLAQRLETAHRSGYRLRFWNIPAPNRRPIEEVWSQLLDAGVDLLSVDDVNAYRDFVVKTGRNDSPERLGGRR